MIDTSERPIPMPVILNFLLYIVQYKAQGGSPEGTLAWVAKQAKPTPLLWCGNKKVESLRGSRGSRREPRTLARAAKGVERDP